MLDCLVIFRFGEIEWWICPSNCDFYTLQNSVWGKANVTNYTDSFFFRRLIFFLRWGTLNKIKEDSTSPKRVCDRSYFTTQVSSDKLMSCFLNSTLNNFLNSTLNKPPLFTFLRDTSAKWLYHASLRLPAIT